MPTKSKKTSTSVKKTANSAKITKPVEQPSASSQAVSILMFFLSILLFLFAVIPGQRVWNGMHIFLHGIFGFCAYIFPLYIAFITVYHAFRKPTVSTKIKFLEVSALIVFFSAFIDVITKHTDDYGEYLSLAYQSEKVFKGGWLGALIGWPFQNWFGSAGAATIIAIFIIALLLISTGTTLVQFIKTFSQPAKKVKDNTINMIEKHRIAEEERKRLFDVSIDGMPENPINPPKNDGTDLETKKNKLLNTYRGSVEEKNTEEEQKDEIEITEDNSDENKQNIDDIIKRLQDDKKKPTPLDIQKKEKRKEYNKNNEEDENSENNDIFSLEFEASKAEYIAPSIELLDENETQDNFDIGDELKQNADLLINTLRSFGVEARIINISRGPAVTRYELQPAAGVKISKITSLSDDIALNLATAGVRIEAPIPNKAAIGIEVPNKNTASVRLKDVINTTKFTEAKSRLTVALGKDITGNAVVADLTKMPHILIAGTTGAGKSVCVNSMILSVLYKATPDEVKMLMIDPKVVELQEYNGIPHLLVPVVTDPRKAAGALGWAVTEMLQRYKTFADNNVRDISSYNDLVSQDGDENIKKMPHILIVIEELADLMMAAPNEVEDAICRLAQMARAAGMHLVIATQRPSVDVVTGLIKANIPSRIALKVANQFDSRTIIDSSGAEKLLGRGDMLFLPVGANKPTRVQGCWVAPTEIARVINFLKNKQEPEYSDKVMSEMETYAVAEKSKKSHNGEDGAGELSFSDELLEQAIECIVESGIGSVSLLQRRLQVGHSRSGRLMDLMEEKGIVGPFEGSKPRKVLITKQQWYEMKNSGVFEENE